MKRSAETDLYWMSEAIKLARKGLYTTSPNPRVGCIIVDENGQRVGHGYHVKAGGPHAEVNALSMAANQAKGATAYVTLEPCSHFGKTPPCADALISAGIKRVVVAMTDPNPEVSGRGIARLQKAGIEVVQGVLKSQAETLNPGFIKRMIQKKPLVRVKLGISLDGKIALSNGQSQWITGADSRRDVQRWRARSCAVLTGSGTVLHDNPSLLVRPAEAGFSQYSGDDVRQPVRVVIDSQNQLADHYQVFSDGLTTYTAISSCYTGAIQSRQPLLIKSAGKRVDLSALMLALGQQQINEVLVEAGPKLVGALFQAGEVDELICYQAPCILGHNAQSMIALPDFTSLTDAIRLKMIEHRRLGDDCRLHYTVVKSGN